MISGTIAANSTTGIQRMARDRKPKSPPKAAADQESAVAAADRRILVLHGPNLNLLGTREPQHYGSQTLAEIDATLKQQGAAVGVQVECFQSNAEHALVERIHAARRENVGFIIINPAAFTHTSVALRDALAGVAIPFIEVHLSNVHAREAFRQHSYFSDKAVGVISGLGAMGYLFALGYALHALED
ncbi:MAG: 3-dehydroquinate dehydratase II [bacterium]|nr:MAG: 3-dehydroquinate dehydratase II [bacterium]KAF0148233.1 MAG: 3-dehydroquinate dehydratase II [bacterium]KAF0167728.1 MAG: 3-dehydroquinate dehydratase II [bacterium]